MANTVEIHIRLLEEGSECSRPTQALDLGNDFFRSLSNRVDAADGVPHLPPDSIVRSKINRYRGQGNLLAIAP